MNTWNISPCLVHVFLSFMFYPPRLASIWQPILNAHLNTTSEWRRPNGLPLVKISACVSREACLVGKHIPWTVNVVNYVSRLLWFLFLALILCLRDVQIINWLYSSWQLRVFWPTCLCHVPGCSCCWSSGGEMVDIGGGNTWRVGQTLVEVTHEGWGRQVGWVGLTNVWVNGGYKLFLLYKMFNHFISAIL